MKVFLVIFFIVLMLVGAFCIWVLCKIAGNTNDMEEQLEIERKLRNKK
jgi:hypothetical protein